MARRFFNSRGSGEARGGDGDHQGPNKAHNAATRSIVRTNQTRCRSRLCPSHRNSGDNALQHKEQRDLRVRVRLASIQPLTMPEVSDHFIVGVHAPPRWTGDIVGNVEWGENIAGVDLDTLRSLERVAPEFAIPTVIEDRITPIRVRALHLPRVECS